LFLALACSAPRPVETADVDDPAPVEVDTADTDSDPPVDTGAPWDPDTGSDPGSGDLLDVCAAAGIALTEDWAFQPLDSGESLDDLALAGGRLAVIGDRDVILVLDPDGPSVVARFEGEGPWFSTRTGR
jgi:hypothetical protein